MFLGFKTNIAEYTYGHQRKTISSTIKRIVNVQQNNFKPKSNNN